MMLLVKVWYRACAADRLSTFLVPATCEERAGREAWRLVLRRWPDAVGIYWRYERVDEPVEL